MIKNFKLALALVTMAIATTAHASSVKHIDGSGGSYAVTCSNGDKSGIISIQDNGQICVTGKSVSAKCSSRWSKESAAEYFCDKSSASSDRNHYVEKGTVLCFEKSSMTSKDGQDEGMAAIRKLYFEKTDGCMVIDRTNIIVLEQYKDYKIPFAKITDRNRSAIGYVYLKDIMEK